MAHNISVRVSLRAGAYVNGVRLIIDGLACSFMNSLIASANGCGIPISITLFGPFRN